VDPLEEKVLQVFSNSRKTYGHRSIRRVMIRSGTPIGRKRTLRIMKANRLLPITVRPSPYAVANRAKEASTAKHRLGRRFAPPKPNRVWASDITYIWTLSGWSYLAVVIDLYSRRIVGFSVSDKPDTALVVSALSQAFVSRSYRRWRLMFHSDQGCQYTSIDLRNYLKARGVLQSMSRKGQCWDNAPTESFFKTFKKETGVGKSWLKNSGEVEAMSFEWIETWYNRQRRHTFLDYYSPAEYEAKWAV
jgi:putative transposase